MSKNDFDVYSILFHDLFYKFIQTATTLFLFVSILNLSKEKADDLYPIDLHSKFYGDGSCDLGNLRPGESSFCDGFTPKVYNETKAGKSISASELAKRAKNNGFITSDSASVVFLWLSYLGFSCEHFIQTMLNGAQKMSYTINTDPPPGSTDEYKYGILVGQFAFIITIISVINNLRLKYIDPFLKKSFNISFKVSSKDQSDIFVDFFTQILINISSIFLLLFLFFMIPLTVFYVFAMFKILTENLTIQMNILSIFALFLTIKSLFLFVAFMQSQFGQNQNGQTSQAFQSFISSYLLYFIIPILVALLKTFKLGVTLLSNISPFGLKTNYKIIFLILILASFYDPIKYNLDYEYDFPYSIIYAVLSAASVAFIIKKNNKNNKTNETNPSI
jgi:hypothetical protein